MTMKNDELLQILESTNSSNSLVTKSEKDHSFVIFSISEKLYSLPSSKVLEVFLSDNIFYIPFCPPYIPGFINRYGEPYVVVDLLALLENEKQISRKFIILRSDKNQIAFMVEDIMDILSFHEDQILLMSPKEQEDSFFSGIIPIDGSNILILQLEKILDRLEQDIE